MKVLKVALLFSMVAVLAACNGRQETSITGAYGQGVISGQVSVNGTGNDSPQGVSVSLRGTGMTTTLAQDGQFTFASVPENGILDFYRADDGISASLTLDQSSGFFAIELSKNQAKKSAKRRGVKVGEKVSEFEGLIRSATAEQIVVFTSHKEEVTINLTEQSIIRKGGEILTFEALLVDTRVHVKARPVTGEQGGWDAVLVIVQREEDDDDGDDDGDEVVVREHEGIVRAIAADQIVVYTSKKKEETFVITADTIIRKGGTILTPEQIVVGNRVHVKATTAEDGTSTAVQIIVQNTQGEEVELEGEVLAVGAADLSVQTADGVMTVQVNNGTQIRKSGSKISLADIEVGDTVEVEGRRVDETTVLAKKISVESE